MKFKTVTTQFLTLLSGEKVFWREAGSVHSPTVLLLHGFPSSSHQFRNLIPLLEPNYRVIAPDLPGFGFTEVPSNYTYTFDNLFNTIDTFLEKIPKPPSKYTLYIFDYGAPVGLRLALKHPEKVQAIVTQSGNAYVDGMGDFWNPIRALWANNSQENRDALLPFLTLAGTKSQYDNGVADPSRLDPASYTLDQALLDRPGNKEIQINLFYDYQNNVKLYPKFQEYFRKSQIPLLACWGEHDIFFIAPGATAYKRDLPNAEIKFLDAGHFATESNPKQIAELMIEFLKKNEIS
ncbi:putative hydrolase [Lindgomyces ingoldianus]|uniref:Hydrolase n=1 Tax=Lindgomyces ingoldianus TaxID=673940 RepID=A0ACB6QK95_9PLEO|nr:putative hydrolase [Lindgomyces ingoldianus]KAF2467379.1 putative hydrolase [Lindgomyces ingoldianus]